MYAFMFIWKEFIVCVLIHKVEGSIRRPVSQLGTVAIPRVRSIGRDAVHRCVIRCSYWGALGNQAVATLVADPTSLTGTVTVSVVASGVAAPGANLPGWEYDYSGNWRV